MTLFAGVGPVKLDQGTLTDMKFTGLEVYLTTDGRAVLTAKFMQCPPDVLIAKKRNSNFD